MAIIFSEPLVMRLFESLMAIDVNIRKIYRFSVLKNEKQKFPIIFEHPLKEGFPRSRIFTKPKKRKYSLSQKNESIHWVEKTNVFTKPKIT